MSRVLPLKIPDDGDHAVGRQYRLNLRLQMAFTSTLQIVAPAISQWVAYDSSIILRVTPMPSLSDDHQICPPLLSLPFSHLTEISKSSWNGSNLFHRTFLRSSCDERTDALTPLITHAFARVDGIEGGDVPLWVWSGLRWFGPFRRRGSGGGQRRWSDEQTREQSGARTEFEDVEWLVWVVLESAKRGMEVVQDDGWIRRSGSEFDSGGLC